MPLDLPSPDAPFDRLSAVERLDPRRARVLLPNGWQQGRGLFGGLVTAVLSRALEASAPDRPLRSLTAEICGPVQPGEATLELDVLREGNAVTTTTARLVQGGEVLAHGVGVLGRARTNERDGVFDAPALAPAWRDVATIAIEPPLGPTFARHFEFRPIRGLPFSGETKPEVCGWVRPRNPGGARDVAFLAACVDAYWPALYPVESVPRPMATVAFTFQPFAHFDGLDPEAPVFYRARLLGVDAGYAVELRELWGEDGRPLAFNQQTFVLIK